MHIYKFRNRHFFLLDLGLLFLAAYFSFVLRLDQTDLRGYWPSFFVFTAFALTTVVVVFWGVGIYSLAWRYASIDDLLRLAGVVSLASIAAGVVSWSITSVLDFPAAVPRSIPFIFLLLSLFVTAGSRFGRRAIHLLKRPRQQGNAQYLAAVMGAGGAGAKLIRELQNNPRLRTEAVILLDDDSKKLGMKIHGVPVVGNRDDIPERVKQHALNLVIIAMPTAPGKTIRHIVQICEQARVPAKIMPSLYELLNNPSALKQLRNVEIEDLLRRDAIHTDLAAVRQFLHGKRVLITGGGGSIGSELARQVLASHPRQLILLGHGENSIFAIYHELKARRMDEIEICPVVADIRFAQRLELLLAHYRPDIIFHAAAHKHVPLMELNPEEAIANNVLGTRNLLRAAQQSGVEAFVMVSTDKAVNPTSVMGASKRLAELLVHQAAERSGQRYVAVRFGNVLGSRGSVVLTFKEQIQRGGPVTVTHPEMKRFFITIPEATQLVLQAAVLGQGGEVFVLDMGEPVKIIDLARDLIDLSGLQVGRDIDIIFTGIRPGEKLFEELFTKEESYERTQHPQIFIAPNASQHLPSALDEAVNRLHQDIENGRPAREIVGQLQTLLPRYTPDPRFQE